jgi:hypothetical protein
MAKHLTYVWDHDLDEDEFKSLLWRKRVRSETRRRGFDFLVAWLPQARPDLL